MLNVVFVLTGLMLIAVGVGRSLAWGSKPELPDTIERRRMLLDAEQHTHDRFGW
jgi:hypothetical protein